MKIALTERARADPRTNCVHSIAESIENLPSKLLSSPLQAKAAHNLAIIQ
jgi:hypothetical protein